MGLRAACVKFIGMLFLLTCASSGYVINQNASREKKVNYNCTSIELKFTTLSKTSSADPIYETANPKSRMKRLTRNKKDFYELYPVEKWKSFGLYNDDYLKVINQHWLEFEPPSNYVHNVFIGLYSIFMVVGCGGNAVVIFLFYRCRCLRTPPNYFIFNLAVSDFLMMAKMPIFIVNSWYRGPVLGALGCKLYGFVGGLSGTTSILTLACISFDRYNAIAHPLNPIKRTTGQRAISMIVAVWLYSCFFSMAPLLGLNNYTSEGFLTSCSFDYLDESLESRVFVFVFFLAAWVVPLTVISFSYWRIFVAVREAGRIVVFNSRESTRSQGQDNQSERKIAKLAAVLIGLWILAWTPYALVALLGIFGWKSLLTPMVSSVPALFCKTASCINPFVYAINHPRFRRELMRSTAIGRVCFYFQTQEADRTGDPTTRNTAGELVTISVKSEAPCHSDSSSPAGEEETPPSVKDNRGASYSNTLLRVPPSDGRLENTGGGGAYYEKYCRRYSSGSIGNTVCAKISRRKASISTSTTEKRPVQPEGKKSHGIVFTNEDMFYNQPLLIQPVVADNSYYIVSASKLQSNLGRAKSLPEIDDIKDFYF